MLAVHLENGTVTMREVPLPDRPRGFALIRLIAAGICNTDLELQRGYYGFAGIPGHEFVGEVVAADDEALRGRRVVGEINLPCRDCTWCRSGMGRHCPRRTVLGIVKHPGAFAEFLTLPEPNLHVVPETLSTEQAVFTEPVAAACEILEQVEIPPGDVVAVLGDGKLGLLVGQVLAANGLTVHQYGRHEAKLRLAREAGLDVRDGTPERFYRWVVEATGSHDGLRRAIAMTRPRGTIILKSTVHGEVPVDTAAAVVQEITLVGSRCGRFEPALELLSRGALRVENMITGCYPLAEAPAAFARAASKGTLKVLLRA